MDKKICDSELKSTFPENDSTEQFPDKTISLRGRNRPKRKRSDSEKSASFSEKGVAQDCGRESPAFLHRDSDNLTLTLRKMEKREKVLRIQIANSDGDRPIHVAVVQENLKLLRNLCTIMLKTAISLDLTNYLRQTPLHLAVMLGNIEMVQLLLKYGSSVTLRDRNGNSIVHLAVKSDTRKEVLRLILSHPLCNQILDQMDYEGYTALHYAVMRRNKTAVTLLQRSGANMNMMDGKSGRSALIHAILERNTDMVNHLLKCGVDVHSVDYSGRCAFELALQGANENIVKLLEKKLYSEEISAISSENDIKQAKTSHRTKQFKST